MTPIGTDGMDSKRELLDHVVYEVGGVLLSMTGVDLQGSNPGSIVDGSILESTNLLSLGVLECEKRNINLDVMARNPFGVTPGVDCSATDVSGQSSQIVTDKGPVNARTGGLNGSVPNFV